MFIDDLSMNFGAFPLIPKLEDNSCINEHFSKTCRVIDKNLFL